MAESDYKVGGGFLSPLFPIERDPNNPRSYLPWKFPQGGGNFPYYDARTQSYRRMDTNELYTGDLPGGQYVLGGRIGPKPAAPVAPTPTVPEPQLRKTVEQEPIASFAVAGQKALPAQAEAGAANFTKWKQEYDATKQASLAAGKKAFDTSKTEAEIRGANVDVVEGTRANLDRLEANQRDYQAQQNALVREQLANIAGFAQQVPAMARQVYGAATRGLDIGQLLNPANPTGTSGALRGKAARVAAETILPFQRELFTLAQGVTGQKAGLQREYFQNEQNQAQYNIAMEDKFGTNIKEAAKYFADLGMRARQMSDDQAFRFLAYDTEIPFISQRLRSGEISIDAALGMLERSAVEFRYEQPYDPSRIPPVSVGTYPSGLPPRTYSYPASAPPLPYLPPAPAAEPISAPINPINPIPLNWTPFPLTGARPNYKGSPNPILANPYRNPRSYVPIDQSRTAGGADYDQPVSYAPVY